MSKRKYKLLNESELISTDLNWVDIPGYEDYFIISENGDVISKQRTIVMDNGVIREKTAKMIKPVLKKNGYVYITLRIPGVSITKRLHRLVAEAFVENPNNYSQVNHIDGNKQNNCASNLEWCSQSQNVTHAYENNLIKHYTRPVLKMDMNTEEVLCEYNSLKSAAESVLDKKLEAAIACIRLCCQQKIGYAYGFKWRYKTKR